MHRSPQNGQPDVAIFFWGGFGFRILCTRCAWATPTAPPPPPPPWRPFPRPVVDARVILDGDDHRRSMAKTGCCPST